MFQASLLNMYYCIAVLWVVRWTLALYSCYKKLSSNWCGPDLHILSNWDLTNNHVLRVSLFPQQTALLSFLIFCNITRVSASRFLEDGWKITKTASFTHFFPLTQSHNSYQRSPFGCKVHLETLIEFKTKYLSFTFGYPEMAQCFSSSSNYNYLKMLLKCYF